MLRGNRVWSLGYTMTGTFPEVTGVPSQSPALLGVPRVTSPPGGSVSASPDASVAAPEPSPPELDPSLVVAPSPLAPPVPAPLPPPPFAPPPPSEDVPETPLELQAAGTRRPTRSANLCARRSTTMMPFPPRWADTPAD